MPAKNSIKQYLESGYYHIYNRGVEKRNIFLDQQDYSVFLSYLKDYLILKDKNNLLQKLSDPNVSYKDRQKILKLINLNNFSGEIKMLSFTLMPNHFHFEIKQNSSNSIDKFMNSLGTRYTMYFNKKYQRVGRLYQDVYKAVLIKSDEQLLYLSKYIHRQALATQGDPLRGWIEKQPSSFGEYTGARKTEWISPEEILSFFSKNNSLLSYESFIKQEESLDGLSEIIIE